MLTDKLNTFSEAAAVTTTALLTNVIDLGPLSGGNAVRDIGAGDPLYLYIVVDEAVTASGSATVTFTLESDSVATIDSSATVHLTTAVIGKATLVAGYEIRLALPPGAYERYLGVRATVATGPLTAGKFTAMLVNAVDTRRDYASGYTTGT
jgi:hypothetical protein